MTSDCAAIFQSDSASRSGKKRSAGSSANVRVRKTRSQYGSSAA